MSTLYGRDQEFITLKTYWHDVYHRRTPRIVSYIAETGFGKSRLVQELYHWLTRECDDGKYWPDVVLDNGTSLQLTPLFPSDYAPRDIPQFLWLGTRWRDPQERNAVDHSALPFLYAQLERHAQLIHAYSSDWTRLIQSAGNVLQSRVGSDVLGIISDQLLPFSSLAIGYIRDVLDNAHPRMLTINDAIQAERVELSDKINLLVRRLLEGKHAIPTVIWFDDIQWIDDLGMQFISTLRRESQAKQWPLLIIATSWPKEYVDRRLHLLFGHVTEHRLEHRLGPIEHSALASMLSQQLRGLSREQADILINRAGGNPLALRESIDELRLNTQYFVDGDIANELNAQGETLIRAWSSNRDERIRQRFGQFKVEIREFLARASVLGVGTQFMLDVIRQYAENRRLCGVDDYLQECIKTYTVIAPIDGNLHEFRDHGYFRAAQSYFEQRLAATERQLLADALDKQLGHWINGSWRDDGNLHTAATCPPGGLLHLSDSEQTAIIDLAIEFTAASPAVGIGLRVRVDALLRCAARQEWSIVRARCHELPTDWSVVGFTDIGLAVRQRLAQCLAAVSEHQRAHEILRTLVVALTHGDAAIPAASVDLTLASVHFHIARLHYLQQHMNDALTHANAALTHSIAHDVATNQESVHDHAVISQFIGRIMLRLKCYPVALDLFNQTLQMRYRLINKINPAYMTDNTIVLSFNELDAIHGYATTLTYIGRTYENIGEYSVAYNYHQRAIDQLSRLQHLRTRIDDMVHLASMYRDLGAIHERKHDTMHAIVAYEHDSALMQQVVAQRGLPDDHKALADAHLRLGLQLARTATAADRAQALLIGASEAAWRLAMIRVRPDEMAWCTGIVSSAISELTMLGATDRVLAFLTDAIAACRDQIATARPDEAVTLRNGMGHLLATAGSSLATR